MTAPLAPRIIAHGNGAGERVLVRWRPVPDATDYNLYVTEAGGDRGVEDQFSEDDVDDSGWFHVYTSILAGVVTVDVTALNVTAEESAASNAVQVILKGGDSEFPPGTALSHVRRSYQ